MFLAAALLLTGVCACQKKTQTAEKWVDLRYRVEDTYNLDATGAKPFSIVVTSTDPWTITSRHPDWCIIDTEEGEGSDPQKVLVGKGEKTTVRIQYYDNTGLDDRTDQIEIRSDYWLGKTVTVNQKGIAFLDIPETELEFDVVKAGGEYSFHILSNQDWSTAVTDGDWISIKEGTSGNSNGVVTVLAQENSQEIRYATVAVFDRHNEKCWEVQFTQDGVQLDPAVMEVRAGYDQLSTSLAVVANSKWKAVKDNDADTWYTIVNGQNDGDAVLNITLTQNDGSGLRVGHILLQSVSPDPDAFVLEKIVTIKQAYRITPVRTPFDDDEMGKWKSDWTNSPIYTKGLGTLFTSQARLNNGSMPFGTYTFRWTNISPESRVRHWFCYSDGQEIKYNIVGTSGTLALDFNASSSGVSGKPSVPSGMAVDISQPVELTVKFDPSGTEYCHVTYLLNGDEIASFDSSDTIMHMVKWGKSVNMYVGVDTGGSAVCEWYEYTAPVNWDE